MWHRLKPIWHNSTPEAQKLGAILHNDYGWQVDFEKFDGHKHIDLAIPEAKVDIEVDGKQHNFSSHQALEDLERTYYSFRSGFLTLRIPNSLVRNFNTIRTTAAFINKFLRESKYQLQTPVQTIRQPQKQPEII